MKRAAVSLPEEVLLEIIVLLKDDVAALFRCAAACKAWRGLLEDPSFLRRCWPEDTCASIAGFFTREQRQGEGIRQPCFVPAPRSPMRCHDLSAFVQPAASAGVMLDRADPLASRHGLLLVRLPCDSPGLYPDLMPVHLAVCNLLAGECHALPPLTRGGPVELRQYWNGYALLSGADYRSESKSLSFKVAVIDADYNLHTFTSGETCWSAPIKCFRDASTRRYTAISYDTAVVCRGTAHWLLYDWNIGCLSTVDMDAETGHLSMTSKIPLQMDYKPSPPCLTLIDGMLSVINIQREGSEVRIWKSVDETSEWICTRTIHLQDKLSEEISYIYMLGEKYGTVIVEGSSRRVYVADLESDTVELLHWPGLHACRQDVVSLQMDWVTFFLSRLRSRYQGNYAGRYQERSHLEVGRIPALS